MANSSKKQIKHISNIQYPYEGEWDAKTKRHVTFTLANVHYSFANALRRAMLSKLTTAGFKSEPHKFSTIKIEKNDTILNNQIISHRIAMIPINIANPDKFDVDDYLFMLDVSNDTNAVKLVTTEDFKVKRISTNTFLSEKDTRELFPADPLTNMFIPIVKLKPKYYTNIGGHDMVTSQEIGSSIKIPVSEPMTIKLTAKLVLSTGNENGHFSPVTVSAYANTIDTTRAAQAEQEYVDSETAKYVNMKLTPLSEEKLRRRFKINPIQRVFVVDESGEPVSFDFRVESIGVIPPLVCFERALRWCIESTNRLVLNLQTGNVKEVNVIPVPHLGNGFEIQVENEDYTLGNMLHSWINNQCADYSLDPSDRTLESITYHKPHPLTPRIVFSVKPISDADPMTVVQTTIKKSCESFIKFVESILTELTETGQYITELKSIINRP